MTNLLNDSTVYSASQAILIKKFYKNYFSDIICKMTIAQIKNYMKKNSITYQMLSDRTGLSLGRLKDIFRDEDSNPTLSTYNKIITALGIDDSGISTGINDMSILNAMEAIGLTDEKLKKLTPNKLKLLADFINLLLEQG